MYLLSSTKMEKVLTRLQMTIDFLNPFLPLANSHMVEFFSKSLWEDQVLKNLKTEYDLLVQRPKSIIDLFKESLLKNNSNLSKFLQDCSNFYPESNDGIIIDIETLVSKFSQSILCETKSFSHNKFMSLKKQHEVEVMSSVVASLSSLTESTHIVDIGDGKGYLSSHLALQFGLKVLGLDSCTSKTLSAADRANKLQKQYHSFNKSITNDTEDDIEKVNRNINDSNISSMKSEESLYKQVTLYTSLETNLKSVLMQNFPDESSYNFGIVGLHTCGSLSPVCLKLFADSKSGAKFLINVGCCYHLLEEEDADSCTFPLSSHLRNTNFRLGRNARMLSLQAPSRLYTTKQISDSLMFRAVFELFLVEKVGINNSSDKKVGRIGSKCKNFLEYCKKGLIKLEIETNIPNKEIEDFYETYSHLKPLLEFYFMLRVSIAPVIENIILLDRLLFLFENEMSNSYFLRLFDPNVSPRCYGIVSIRN